jgi:hypothetical protein
MQNFASSQLHVATLQSSSVCLIHAGFPTNSPTLKMEATIFSKYLILNLLHGVKPEKTRLLNLTSGFKDSKK